MNSQANSHSVEQVLAETERSGLLLVLNIRSALVIFIMLFIAGGQGIATGYFGIAVCSVFLGSGLIYRWLVQRRMDRGWMRYGFVALDAALLAVVATAVPLSLHGDVPQIFVFRVYGVKIFFFLVATSALSLSPRLVLWTGLASVAAIWSAWGWIVSGMETWVSWSDIVEDRTAEKYIEITLDPNHIAIADRVLDSVVIILTAVVIAAAVQRARKMLRQQVQSERARAEVAEVFGRFVPEEVVESLSHSGGALPAEERTASVMFVDIEGFTSLSERKTPEALVELLDAFFDEVGNIAAEHRGVCISLIGDAALVAFNAPLDNADHAECALRCGEVLLRRSMETRFAGISIAIRVGVATGLVAAGTVGGRGRRSYTLYGDTVNLAQRLEARNKESGTRLLIDEATYQAAGSPDRFRYLDTIRVKGRDEPVRVFSPDAETSIPH